MLRGSVRDTREVSLALVRRWALILDGQPAEPVDRHEFASAWRGLPFATILFAAATAALPVFFVRGWLALFRLLDESDSARRAFRRATGGATRRGEAVFISYRTRDSASYARELARGLEDAGLEVWRDVERGTLPTFLLYLDRVLEASVRDARVVVAVQSGAGDGAQRGSDLVENADRALASALRWLITASWIVAFFMPIFLLFVPPFTWAGLRVLALVQASDDPGLVVFRRCACMSVPPLLRSWWYLSLAGVLVEKHHDESWHEWELRLASLYGISVIAVTPGRNLESVLAAVSSAERPDPTAPVAALQAELSLAIQSAAKHPFRLLGLFMFPNDSEQRTTRELIRRVAELGDRRSSEPGDAGSQRSSPGDASIPSAARGTTGSGPT